MIGMFFIIGASGSVFPSSVQQAVGTQHGRILGQRSVGVGSVNGKDTIVEMGVSDGFTVQNRDSHHHGWMWLTGGIFRLLGNIVLSGLLVAMVPSWMTNITRDMDRESLRAVGIGCFWNIGLLVAVAGLTVIIVGIPFALLVGDCRSLSQWSTGLAGGSTRRSRGLAWKTQPSLSRDIIWRNRDHGGRNDFDDGVGS